MTGHEEAQGDEEHGHGGNEGPNPLEYLVEEELTPELKAEFTQLGEEWLDLDKQMSRTTELGGRINKAYEHTIGEIANLHQGKDYAEDFGKDAFKVAKRLFENDRTDYVHDRKQARQIVTKFMVNILHEMGTKTAHAIAHAYEHSEGTKNDDERFEYLKTAFQNELGIGNRDDEDGVSIDQLIATITGRHRAKTVLLDATAKMKNNYTRTVTSKKLSSVITGEREKAYKRFVEGFAEEKHLHADHAKTAFHRTPQWATIHSELYNHERYEQPYRQLEQFGVGYSAGHDNHGNGGH